MDNRKPNPPRAEIYATFNKQFSGHGVPISTLLKMLKFKRPHNTGMEAAFLHRFIDCLPGVRQDEFGNRIVTIGEAPKTLFSCHVDTVHRNEGIQDVIYDLNLSVVYKDDGQCLGADDAAGIWVLMNLIEAKVPGLYIFHRGEERGLLGSTWIANNTPALLDSVQHAVAFDRKDTCSIITHQCANRCCSDDFADALSKTLALSHERDSTGSFTDTASYMELVSECTNVSVGYYNEHTAREKLDLAYLSRLVHAAVNADWASLPATRDHTVVERDVWTSRYPRQPKAAKLPPPPPKKTAPVGMGQNTSNVTPLPRHPNPRANRGGWEEYNANRQAIYDAANDDNDDRPAPSWTDIFSVAVNHPDVIASILEDLNVTYQMLDDYLEASGFSAHNYPTVYNQ